MILPSMTVISLSFQVSPQTEPQKDHGRGQRYQQASPLPMSLIQALKITFIK
ncbi:hypothetical protein V3595_09310 [Bacillus sp. CFBP9009]